MSVDFECDFSEGSLNERKTSNKKKHETKDKSIVDKINNDYLGSNPKLKEDCDAFKPSKLAKKNLKYFLIYFDGTHSSAVIRNYVTEKRIDVTSDRVLDFSRNVYFMLIDHRRSNIEGILKKDYVKESSTEDSSKKVYKIKIEIKSRQQISQKELVEGYTFPKESLKTFFRCVPIDLINIGKGLSMTEISDDASVDTFESIRNSMIKKEEAEKKKSKIKRSDSYRKRGRSLSSSSGNSKPRRSDLKEKFITSQTTRNFDMNYYKLQYENYLKNAASFFSSQSMGNANNSANVNNKSITASHGLNPLVNHMYQNHFANFYPQNQPNYKPELNAFQNNFPNLNIMPSMFPMLNPYMHMVAFNQNFPQSFPPVAIDLSEDQKKHIERININNYNIIKNTNSETKKKKTTRSRSSSSSSSLDSVKSTKRGKYFDLKHLNEYKELELKMKKEGSEMNLNDMNLMDNDFNKNVAEKKQSRSSSSSENNKKLHAYSIAPDQSNNTLNAKKDDADVKASSSVSYDCQKSRSINSSSSYSKDDYTSRRETKKHLYGNKRKRSNSRSYSRKYSRDNSYSDLSNNSKSRNSTKYNNNSARPYYSNSNKPNLNHEPHSTNRFRNYNNYKLNYENDYNEKRKTKQFDNNFGHKNNSYFDRDNKNFDRDRNSRQNQDHSRNYIQYKPKSICKEDERYARKESQFNYKQKEMENISSNKHEEDASNVSQSKEEVKEMIGFVNEPRDPSYKRVSNFSNYPLDNSLKIIDSENAKDPKIKNSNFSCISYSNYIDSKQNSQRDEPNRPYNSFNNNRPHNNRYNYINANKNKNATLNYRYETINDFNKYKTTSESKDRIIIDPSKDDKNLAHTSKDPITQETQQNKLERGCKAQHLEKIQLKEGKKDRDNSVLKSHTSSKIEKFTNLASNYKISLTQNLASIDNDIRSNLKVNNDVIITKTEDVNRKIQTANLVDDTIETSQCKNSQNVSYSSIAVDSIALDSVKSHAALFDKNTASNFVNQSTQRAVVINSNVNFGEIKFEEINKPSKSLTDLSAMLEKNNNFKIINVLGKKKIILNKDRKNPDIKLKNLNN